MAECCTRISAVYGLIGREVAGITLTLPAHGSATSAACYVSVVSNGAMR